MQLLARMEVMESGGGLEGSGEDKVVRGDTGEGHVIKGEKRILETIGTDMGTDVLEPRRRGREWR